MPSKIHFGIARCPCKRYANRASCFRGRGPVLAARIFHKSSTKFSSLGSRAKKIKNVYQPSRLELSMRFQAVFKVWAECFTVELSLLTGSAPLQRTHYRAWTRLITFCWFELREDQIMSVTVDLAIGLLYTSSCGSSCW